MKYIVKIDNDTNEGATALKLLKKLNAPKKAISFEISKREKKEKLSDEKMALPGKKPSEENFNAWVAETDESESYSLKETKAIIQNRLIYFHSKR